VSGFQCSVGYELPGYAITGPTRSFVLDDFASVSGNVGEE